MSVCVYMCVYMYMCVCMYAFMYVCMYTAGRQLTQMCPRGGEISEETGFHGLLPHTPLRECPCSIRRNVSRPRLSQDS